MRRYINNGVIAQEVDPRDYSIRVSAAAQLPEEAIKQCDLPHLDQQVSKCVMCTAETALSEYYGYPVGGNWGYGYFREHEGPGLVARKAYSMLGDYGLPRTGDDIAELEVTDVIDRAKRYAPRILPLAETRKGWTYTRLTTREEIAAAIVKSLNVRGMRVVFSSTVGCWGLTEPGGWLRYEDGGGRHMMVILGYGKHESRGSMQEGLLVRNSWGDDFGLNGDCWMTWDAVMRNEEVYLLIPPEDKPIHEDTPEDKPVITVQRSLWLKSTRMTGDDVREAQMLLIAHGFDVGSSGADGIFGSKTDEAVRAFQQAKGLKVDGIIGAKTWAALRTAPDPAEPVLPYEPSELALGLVRHCYAHIGDIYGWSGNGQKFDTTADAEAWLRRNDDAGDPERSIRFMHKQIEAGVTDLAVFDCSGLISRYLQDIGIVSSKRNCDHLWAMCTPVTRAELRPGDLLFRSRNGDMYHVGVYAGRGRVIEAKGRDDGVVLRGIDASGAGYWNKFGRLNALQK